MHERQRPPIYMMPDGKANGRPKEEPIDPILPQARIPVPDQFAYIRNALGEFDKKLVASGKPTLNPYQRTQFFTQAVIGISTENRQLAKEMFGLPKNDADFDDAIIDVPDEDVALSEQFRVFVVRKEAELSRASYISNNSPETLNRDNAVEQLFQQGLKRPEIMTRLSIKRGEVVASMHRNSMRRKLLQKEDA